MTCDVLVLAFATEETAYFPALRASAAEQGFRFEVIGLGRQWQGFVWANSLIMERTLQCEPDELVLVLDGYDTLLVMPCVEMLLKYQTLCSLANERSAHTPTSPPGQWLVVGIEHPPEEADWLYWHTIVCAARRYHSVPPSVTHYLNTGAMLGPARHLATYMSETCKHASETGSNDDQRTANALYWGQWVDENDTRVSRPHAPLPIALDTTSDLFYCHCERRLLQLVVGLACSPNNFITPLDRVLALREGGVWRKSTGRRVGVVHGIWNTNMNALCEYMGLPHDPNYHKEISQPDIRMFARVARAVLIWPGGPLLLVAMTCAMASRL